MAAELKTASADAPAERSALTRGGQRVRPVGRIGGLTGVADPAAAQKLARALGPEAWLLPGSTERHAVAADWDSCRIDGTPVAGRDQWRALAGPEEIGRVRGAYVAAWIVPDGTLSLARDPVGERTLYYAALPGGGMVFASTVRALLATGLVERTLNLRAVARYLSYGYMPGPETLVSGIRELLPGELVRYRRGVMSSTRHWTLPEEGAQQGADEAALRRDLRARLEEAVRRRLPGDEAVGAFLSGGIDSSLVVALVRKLHDRPVHTYSVSFGREYPNELAFSSLVARHCGTRHRIVEISSSMIARDFDSTMAMIDKPIGDPLTVPNAVLFREASADAAVVFNGEGGDPCFGGPKNQPMLLAELLGDGNAAAGDPYRRERSYLRAHLKCYDELDEMLEAGGRDAITGDALEEELAPYFGDARWSAFVNKLMAINLTFKGAHHILNKVDSVSAPCGMLPRSPLFDQAVVELAFAIPPALKLRGSVEKYLLKEAVRDLLPAQIIERPKSGMLVPVEAWFRGPLRNFARERLLDGLAPWGVFRRDYLERLLARRLGGLHPRHGIKIWMLLTLESWLRGVLGPRQTP